MENPHPVPSMWHVSHKRKIHGPLHAGHMLSFLTHGAERRRLKQDERSAMRPDGLAAAACDGLVKCPERDGCRAWVHFSHWLIEPWSHRFLVKMNIQQMAWILFMLIKVLQKKMTSYHCHCSSFVLFFFYYWVGHFRVWPQGKMAILRFSFSKEGRGRVRRPGWHALDSLLSEKMYLFSPTGAVFHVMHGFTFNCTALLLSRLPQVLSIHSGIKQHWGT